MNGGSAGEDRKAEAQTHKATGNTAFATGKYQEAIAAFTKAIECDGTGARCSAHPPPPFPRSNSLTLASALDLPATSNNAPPLFAAHPPSLSLLSAPSPPPDHVFFSNRSASYASLEQYKEAIADAEKCIELNPSWGKGYTRLGLAKFKSGDLLGAKEAYRAGMKVRHARHPLA